MKRPGRWCAIARRGLSASRIRTCPKALKVAVDDIAGLEGVRLHNHSVLANLPWGEGGSIGADGHKNDARPPEHQAAEDFGDRPVN